MKIKNLAIIKGNSVEINDSTIVYKAQKKVTQRKSLEEPPNEIAVIRADTNFNSGTLEFKFKVSTYDSGILLTLESYDGVQIACGYSLYRKTFVITPDPIHNEPYTSGGSLINYKLNTDILFKLEIKGSQLSLYINNVLICNSSASLKDKPLELRLHSNDSIIVRDIEISDSAKQKIFTVMQFTQEYNELYNEVINPVVTEFGYECIRADEYYTSTPILKDIIDSIQNSKAIIAEITPNNPNVFYEIGYSHAIGKPTILLCDRKRETLPFDVSSFRTLFYENTIAGKKKVENKLREYLKNI